MGMGNFFNKKRKLDKCNKQTNNNTTNFDKLDKELDSLLECSNCQSKYTTNNNKYTLDSELCRKCTLENKLDEKINESILKVNSNIKNLNINIYKYKQEILSKYQQKLIEKKEKLEMNLEKIDSDMNQEKIDLITEGENKDNLNKKKLDNLESDKDLIEKKIKKFNKELETINDIIKETKIKKAEDNKYIEEKIKKIQLLQKEKKKDNINMKQDFDSLIKKIETKKEILEKENDIINEKINKKSN